MTRIVFGLCAALLLVGCGDAPTRPLYDGYTLRGLVLDAETGAPVNEAEVLVGLDPKREFHLYAVTDANGGFWFRPSPGTAPSIEVFRLAKAGYVSTDVAARTATRVQEFLYRLEVRIQPEP